MNISALNSISSVLSTSLCSSPSTTQADTASASQSIQFGGDSFEMSSSAKSKSSSSNCPQGNSTCLGCGSCQNGNLSVNSANSSSQTVNYNLLAAQNAYAAQMKYL